MKQVTLNPSEIHFLPTRRSPPKQWKLDSLEKAFTSKEPHTLPEFIVFETKRGLLVADGNHRILLAMKHQIPIHGVQLKRGEELILQGNPTLNYGKHAEYTYQNFGSYLAYIS